MKKHFIFLAIISIIAFAGGCKKDKKDGDDTTKDSTSTTNKPNTTNDNDQTANDNAQSADQKTAEFEKVYNAVLEALTKGDYNKVNQYVDKKTGVFKLYRPGVFGMIEHTANISEAFMGMEGNGRFKDICKPTEASFPEMDCETGEWNKQGCFMMTTSDYKGVTGMIKALEDAMPDMAPDLDKEAAACEKNIRIGVLRTADDTKLYFSEIDGKWYLSIIDLQYSCGV